MKIALVIALLLLFSNLLFLNYKVFIESRSQDKEQNTGFQVVHVASPSGEAKNGEVKVIDSCYPYSCVDLIRQATASSVSKTTASAKQGVTSSSSQAKEYYITLGSGQTQSDGWTDIVGLTAYIDSTKYGKIKKVTFEASMYIQNAHGRVYAQLFNVTDEHPVWFSEISMEGDTSQLLISQPITLDSGNKLYKAQMKTSLKDVSLIDQARVHIISE